MTIPTILVSGYLGAGKTTLINAFLHDPQGLRATVLVNDFGAVNLDADLIENADGNTIALTNGCACCAIGDDLLSAARQVVESPEAALPDLVVVEASGVAEPARMAMLLRGVAGLAPAAILTLVNGSTATRNAKDKFVGRLFVSQINNAHFVAVNRTMGHEKVVSTLVAQHGLFAVQVTTLMDAVNAQLALSRTRAGVATEPPEFFSRVIDLPNPVSEAAVVTWCENLPDHIHRVKGLMQTTSGLRKLDYCQGKFTLVPAGARLKSVPQRIVLIGTQKIDTLQDFITS